MLAGLAEHCAGTLAATGAASVSVAVARDGEVVHAEAAGLADVAAGRPATTGTAYLLASVTKPITATGVCLAAEAGLLDLDDPVEKHLGGIRLPRRRHRGAPTVRQVLGHRAGLGGHFDFSYADEPAALPPARRAIERYGTLYHEPGSRFEYSNLGYGVLDVVLENVTGRDPAAYARDRIFAPLGLTSCHIGPSYEGPAGEAVRHSADGLPYPVYDTSHRGASLGWATAPDLAMFGLTQAGGPGVLGPAATAAMRAALPVGAGRGDGLGYGLGWFVSRSGGHEIVGHSGSMGGVATMLAVVPGLRLAVSVLTNSSGAAARTSVVEYVMAELVPGFTAAALPPFPVRERAMRVPPGAWEGLIGTEAGAVPLALRLGADGRLAARLDGGEPAPALIVTASADWDLRAAFALQLPTPDARLNTPLLMLELNEERGTLTGAARAVKNGEDGGRLGNQLSHWCELNPAEDSGLVGAEQE
ncbi:hypothetical protein Misp01_57980 [Microtetraspora sp. NBRC 13810]|uniref:serine hydrolase domain-containing protein n=1 Tax=Microtetraspora sp. NBRC 13810 TaxID=3030990 RepID=UPI0024A0B6DB|nr:serine hydrolase domain-containing protein [Microtetraspora sp. NBRC 13810]GLW10670.1 hypothetical protein Misp01_57980 [Microtetraspora sp. NBRC 13810]